QTDHSIASGLSTPLFFTPRRSGRGVPCAGWWLPWSHPQAQPRFIVPGRLTALRHVFIGASEPPFTTSASERTAAPEDQMPPSLSVRCSIVDSCPRRESG